MVPSSQTKAQLLLEALMEFVKCFHKYRQGRAVGKQTFCRRDTAGTRVWWQGQLLPPLPAASDCTLGKGMNPEMEKHIEDTEYDLKFIFGVIVSTSLLHFWSFPPCLVVFYSVGFSQFFVLWGFQAGFSL